MSSEERERLVRIWGPNLLRCPEIKAKADASNAACDAELLRKAEIGAEVLRARGIDPGFTTLEQRAAVNRLELAFVSTHAEPSDPNAWLAAARAKCDAVALELRASSWRPAAALATADGYADETNVCTRSI